ncbi:MAG: HAMP domain-containing protein [Treponema sp.]|nr:HAMP domain-containing protein [Treponema sp.]
MFAIIIALMLSRKIVRPLASLTSATKRIAAGDYTKKLSIITNDEMGNLADTFNDMTESLAENHGIINKYIGDAIMAVFGAPVTRENHALDAFRAAFYYRKILSLSWGCAGHFRRHL